MSSLLICATIFTWHIWWNIVINDGQGNKLLYKEQLACIILVALGILSITEWNWIMAICIIIIWSIVYYINLIHMRFFGHIIGLSQIKQFITNKETALVNGAMVVQAAGRLIKLGDLCFSCLSSICHLCIKIICLFRCSYKPFCEVDKRQYSLCSL